METYARLLSSLTEEQLKDEYEDNEMERFSRKVSDFFQSIVTSSVKDASVNLGILVYCHHKKTSGNIRGIPYKGKAEYEPLSLDFDLKNIPPVLSRLLSRYIDEVLFDGTN